MKPFQLFAACLPGLERLLAQEMDAADFGTLTIEAGGVSFAGHRNAVYRANLELGLATRILVRIGTFHTRSFPHLVHQTAALPWHEFLHPGQPFRVRASCQKSKLYHSGGVEQRVANGIIEQLAATPPLEPPGEDDARVPCVRVQVIDDQCSMSLDSSGDALHRRGYRLEVAKAPLREDIARALLLVSGWDRSSPLVDPLMGAGTIPIEAALLARGVPPGGRRAFAFEQTPLYEAERFAAVRSAAEARVTERAPAPIAGSDRDAGAVAAARGNAERAGVSTDLELACCALSEAPFLCGTPAASAHGALVTNPPWGQRVGKSRELHRLYQTLGKLATGMPASWTIAILSGNRRLALRTGLKLRSAFLTDHGGTKVRALVRRAEFLRQAEEGTVC